MKDVKLDKSDDMIMAYVLLSLCSWLVAMSLYNAHCLHHKNNVSGRFQNIFGFISESLEIKLED